MENKTELYANIKKRRLELKMSQQELAEALGYSGKSMISQIEKGLVDLPSSMITKFANALRCTEAYLMGWSEDVPPIEKIDDDSEIKRLYDMYQKATPEVRSAVETLLRSATKQS